MSRREGQSFTEKTVAKGIEITEKLSKTLKLWVKNDEGKDKLSKHNPNSQTSRPEQHTKFQLKQAHKGWAMDRYKDDDDQSRMRGHKQRNDDRNNEPPITRNRANRAKEQLINTMNPMVHKHQDGKEGNNN